MSRSPGGDIPTISDAELSVLRELWDRESATPSELHAALSGKRGDWAYTTLQTFLHRLHDKGFVRRRRAGRAWIYEPLLTREETLRGQVEREVERLGAPPQSALVLGLLDGTHLGRRDIARLRKLIDAAEAKLGGRSGKPRG